VQSVALPLPEFKRNGHYTIATPETNITSRKHDFDFSLDLHFMSEVLFWIAKLTELEYKTK
jgi:hypothetical protein